MSMELRVCYICKEEKDLELFSLRNSNSQVRMSRCKVCSNLRRRETRKHKMLHDEEFRKQRLEVRKQQGERFRKSKPKETKVISQEEIERRKKLRKEKTKVISQEEIERRKKLRKEKRKERLQTDSMYKLKIRLRKSIRESFRRRGKRKDGHRTHSILGAEIHVVYEHFESLFVDGMSWENMGKWHIDHIIPLSTAITEEDVIRLCHYTNLQPLWAEDNLKKSNKLDWSKSLQSVYLLRDEKGCKIN